MFSVPVFEWLEHSISGPVIKWLQPLEYQMGYEMVVQFKIPLSYTILLIKWS
jgi:hypothetical protein